MMNISKLALGLLSLARTIVGSSLQFCRVHEGMKSDLCLALNSYKNITTDKNDLSLHISVRLVEERTGWAGFGVGDQMDKALMFILYPGVEERDVTVSIRSTMAHTPPWVTPEAPEIHVTRAWIDGAGLYNAQILCYDCEKWGGNPLKVTNKKQFWLWGTNYRQETRSADPDLLLVMHTDRGIEPLDMTSSYSAHEEEIAQVTAERISITPAPPLEQKPKHHKHSAFGIVSIHGFLLSVGFLSLTGGILAIRSGLPNAFKLHWVIQAIAGSAIVVGCLLGIKLSFAHGGHFNKLHQIIGLSIFPVVIIQGLLGYWHHVNYVKFGRRTKVSYYHVWAGRVLLLAGNINAWLGMRLAHAEALTFYIWFGCVLAQFMVLVPMWYFWSRGQTVLELVRGQEKNVEDAGYATVEQEAFILGDDDFDDDDDDDEERGKKGDLEMK